MITEQDKIFKNLPHQRELTLPDAQAYGDFVEVEDLLKRSKEELSEIIFKSRLREKDQKAFYVSEKWQSFLGHEKQSVLVIDASKGLPGDVGFLHLIYYETYKIIEGALLAAFITGCHKGYLYVSADQVRALSILQRALKECYAQGLLGNKILGTNFSFDLYLHWGSCDYVSYKSDNLVDSLAGQKQPDGTLFGMSVLIHKVETVASLPTILKKGLTWFLSLGTSQSQGTKIFSFSGHVNKPCVIEEAFGVSLRSTIENYAGGVRGGWSHLSCIFPSGIGSPIATKTFCHDLMLSYENLNSLHSWLGSGAIIVVNGSLNCTRMILSSMEFFLRMPVESCLFCMKGLPLCFNVLKNQEKNLKSSKQEISVKEQLIPLSEKIEMNCRCGYAHQALVPIKDYLAYSEDFLNHNHQEVCSGQGGRTR